MQLCVSVLGGYAARGAALMLRRHRIASHSSQGLDILQRKENEGMDIAAHNVTLEWVARGGRGSKYAHFIFLNSSVRGPFVPMFMPPGWQWTQAFTTGLSATTKVSTLGQALRMPVDMYFARSAVMRHRRQAQLVTTDVCV